MIPILRSLSILFLAIAAIGYGDAAPQRDTGIVLGPTVRISHFGSPHVEQAWLAASPTDARRLMACGTFADPAALWNHSWVAVSTDGGATWRQTLMDGTTSWMSEPACVFGSGKHAYFTVGASDVYDGQPHHESGHTHVFTSTDDGATWSKPYSRADGWIDWPYLAVVPSKTHGADTVVFFGNHTTDKLGHWMTKRPAVQEWDDAAGTLSAPITMDGPDVVGTFSDGGLTLADGTTLFAAPSRTLGAASFSTTEGGMHVFAYTVADHTLKLRATLRKVIGSGFGFPSLVQASAGPFKGRLYATWAESTVDASQIWIATSDDAGSTWSSRAVRTGLGTKGAAACGGFADLSQSQVAVDARGTVALQWVERGTTLLLATSADGGKTFGESTLLTSTPGASDNATQYLDWTVPFNEYWHDEVVLQSMGKPFFQMLDPKRLGLSVRLGPVHYIREPRLVADAKGALHSSWSQPQPDSKFVYMTRTVAIAPSAASLTPLGARVTDEARDCSNSPELQSPRDKIPDPVVPPTADSDVTSSFALVPTGSAFDPGSHLVTANFQLVNKTDKPLTGRYYVRALGLHSAFGTAQPLFDRLDVPAGDVAPHAQSPALQMKFTIADYKPLKTFLGNAAAMYIRVYQAQ